MNEPIDFLSIGDTVTEPFIRIKSATVQPGTDKQPPQLCMPFGDKIPYESATVVAAVGNAANAAVSAARLGLGAALHAYVGNDRYGKEILETLNENGVSTEFMITEEGKLTNYHFVLWHDTDRTILVNHELYDYAVPAFSHAPKWMYLTSLAAGSLPYQEALVALLDAWPDTKLAFQPGTFQLQAGAKACAVLYARADIVFCNKQEAQRILETTENDIRVLLSGMRALGPKVAVITEGTSGAYADDGTQAWFVPMYPDTKGPFERTGAGDAFASTVASALALGKTLDEALLWGPINSMAVVQEIGAQKGLLTRESLEALLAQAPDNYTLTLLS